MRYFVRFQTLIIAPITTNTKKEKFGKKEGRKKKYSQDFQQFLFPFTSSPLSKMLEHTTFLMLARE